MDDIEGASIAVICRNQDEENAAFKQSDKENRPHLFIQKRRKYAKVECDMLPSNTSLTKDAIDEIREIQEYFIEIACNNSNNSHSAIRFSIDGTIIAIHDLLVPNAKAFARKIEPIVTDPSNHEY